MQRSSTLDPSQMSKLRAQVDAERANRQGVISGGAQNQSLSESLSHMNLSRQAPQPPSSSIANVSRHPSSSRRPQVKFTLEHDTDDEDDLDKRH